MSETELPDMRLSRQYARPVPRQDSSGPMNSYRPTAACKLHRRSRHQKFLSGKRESSWTHAWSVLSSIRSLSPRKTLRFPPHRFLAFSSPLALLNRTSKSYDISNSTPTTIIPCSDAHLLAPIELTILTTHYHILIPQLSQSLCPIPSPSIVRIRPQ